MEIENTNHLKTLIKISNYTSEMLCNTFWLQMLGLPSAFLEIFGYMS